MPDASVRNRRLALLVVIAIILTATIGVWYAYQSSQMTHRLSEARRLGLEAYQNKDYATAIEHLDRYTRAAGDDTEVMIAFGNACLADPSNDIAQAVRGVRTLRQAALADPNNTVLGHQVLDHMAQLGMAAEGLEQADDLLSHNPQDLVAHRAKTRLLARTRRHQDALDAAQTGLATDPMDTALLLMSIELHSQLGDDPVVLIASTRELAAAHPDDPRGDLALALAYSLAGDRVAARGHLNAAAQHPIANDTDYLRYLVALLDDDGRFVQSREILGQYTTPTTHLDLHHEWIARLFEAGQLDETVVAIDALPQPLEITTLQAIKAQALEQLNRPDDAAAARAQLAARSEAGAAWARALDPATDADTDTAIETATAALDLSPGSPYLQFQTGQALARAGKPEQAQTHWRRAMRIRPPWAAPRIRLAELALNRQNHTLAAQRALQAQVRQPNNLRAAVLFIVATTADPTLTDDTLTALLEQIDHIQAAAPGETYTQVARTEILARLGRTDRATASAQALLTQDPAADRAALLRLTQVCRRYSLPVADQVEHAITDRFGASPELTLAAAERQARAGDPDGALALIDNALATAPPHQRTDWMIARTQLIAQAHPDRAGAAWVELADALPESSRAQALALATPPARRDRAFMDRATTRLEQLAGPDSSPWRIYRAVYLLSAPDAEPAAAARQASDLLKPVLAQDPTHVQALMIDARCQQLMGQEQAAMDRIRVAAQTSPDNPAIGLEQARLAAELGLESLAIDAAEHLARHAQSTPPQRTAAASILARFRQTQTARDILTQLQARQQLSPDAAGLLARLQIDAGQLDAAAATLAPALATDTPTPEAVVLGARIAYRQGQLDQAQTLLTRLDTADLPPARRHALLGEYYIATGQPGPAAEQLRAAALADPSQAASWIPALVYAIDTGQAEPAAAALTDALKHVPTDPGFVALDAQRDALLASADLPQTRPLLLTVLTDADHRAAARKALALFDPNTTPDMTPPQRADALVLIANQNPDFLPAWTLAIKACRIAGRTHQAADLAQQAMTAFPSHPEPAALAAHTLTAVGRWDQARSALAQWRHLSPTLPLEAEVLAAQIELGLGQPQTAAARLAPIIETVSAAPDPNPDTHTGLILTYARALAASGRTQEAAALLTPLLERSANWRLAYLSIGQQDIHRPDAAMAWLIAADPAIPDEAENERIAQVQALWTVARRTRDAALADEARRRADVLVAAPGASHIARYLRATLAEQTGDLALAETDYRAIIASNPQFIQATNNLAMTLARRGQKPDEAIALARQAVAARPQDPNVLDTLAYTLAAAGQREQALAAIDQAIALDPGNQAWIERRAELATPTEVTPPEVATPEVATPEVSSP